MTVCNLEDLRHFGLKVNKFSNQRVRDDIYYIAQHVPKNVHSMFISDLNFGMLPGDLETCDHIADAQNEYNYPQRIIATTGKNNKEGVVEAIRRLSDNEISQYKDKGYLKGLPVFSDQGVKDLQKVFLELKNAQS